LETFVHVLGVEGAREGSFLTDAGLRLTGLLRLSVRKELGQRSASWIKVAVMLGAF